MREVRVTCSKCNGSGKSLYGYCLECNGIGFNIEYIYSDDDRRYGMKPTYRYECPCCYGSGKLNNGATCHFCKGRGGHN